MSHAHEGIKLPGFDKQRAPSNVENFKTQDYNTKVIQAAASVTPSTTTYGVSANTVRVTHVPSHTKLGGSNTVVGSVSHQINANTAVGVNVHRFAHKPDLLRGRPTNIGAQFTFKRTF